MRVAEFSGIEMRQSLQRRGHCTFAYNVDFARGELSPRPGAVSLAGINSNLTQTYIKSFADTDDGLPVIAIAGVEDSEIKLYLVDRSGNGRRLETGCTITTPLKCSIVRLPIVGTNALGVAFITNHGCWKLTSASGSELDFENDASRTKADALYVDDGVRASIAVTHLGATYYSGWGPGVVLNLGGTLATDQLDLPEYAVGAVRSQLVPGQSLVLYSDVNEPAGLNSLQTFAVSSGETIRCLGSFLDQLIVVTDKSLYTLSGAISPTGAYSKLSLVYKGLDCVSHHSFVAAGPYCFWVGSAGVWVFDGQRPVLLAGLDPLFTGRWDRSRWNPTLKLEYDRLIGGSLRIAPETAKGGYVPSLDRVLFTMEWLHTGERTCIALDPKTMGMSLWGAVSGDTWIEQADGEFCIREGYLCALVRGQPDSTVSRSDPDGFPLFWESPLLSLQEHRAVRFVRVVHDNNCNEDIHVYLASGKQAGEGYVERGEEEGGGVFWGDFDWSGEEGFLWGDEAWGEGNWNDADESDDDGGEWSDGGWAESKCSPRSTSGDLFTLAVLEGVARGDTLITPSTRFRAFELEFAGGKGER